MRRYLFASGGVVVAVVAVVVAVVRPSRFPRPAVGATASARAHLPVAPAPVPHVSASASSSAAPVVVMAPKRSNGQLAIALVVVDGVRWQEVFGGVDAQVARAQNSDASTSGNPSDLLPNLTALRTTRGASIGASDQMPMLVDGNSYLSLPGYVEILTGRRDAHCGHNECGHTHEPTLVDEFIGQPGTDPRQVAVVTSWPNIERIAALHPHATISVGRHGGVTRDRFAYDEAARGLLTQGEGARSDPGEGDFRPDRITAPIALKYLRQYKPRFMFLGLGDADEHAHVGDYAKYLEALRFEDKVIGDVAAILDRRAEEGARTALFVTTDHGRARDFASHGPGLPECARVWLVAAGTEIVARGDRSGSVQRRLTDIAPTIRKLAALSPDESADHGQTLDELFTPP